MHLGPRAFSRWDTATHAWAAPPGTYTVLARTSSRDLPLGADVTRR
jgi:fibronectin type III domain protein